MIRDSSRDPVYLTEQFRIEWDKAFISSHEKGVPVIGQEAADILADLLLILQPKRILEIGTGMGFSTFILHAFKHRQGHVVTIDSNCYRLEDAANSFARAGITEEIIPLFGDAINVIPKLIGQEFDFIFIDAQKSQYCSYLDLVECCLADQGVVVADDALFHAAKGEKFNLRIHKNSVAGLESFRTMIMDKPWKSIIFPVEDGISLTWRTGGKTNG